MKNLNYLTEKSTEIAVFFSSIAGVIGSIGFLIIADCVMNAFAIGTLLGVRMMNMLDGASVNWTAFGFALFITLGLQFSAISSFLLLKNDVSSITDGAKKQLAKMANQKLDKLGNILCNFSAVISLMSVGVFMFDGVSTEMLLIMIKTPLFYCKLFLFIPIAIGVPRAISGLSRYTYVFYNKQLTEANKSFMVKVDKIIENNKEVKLKRERKGQMNIESFLNN